MEKKELIEIISNSKLMMNISIDDIEKMVNAKVGRIIHYTKGEILIREGTPFNAIILILRGKVSVKRLFRDGAESQVHMLRENGVIGMELLRKPVYGSFYYYVAQTDVDIYSISQKYFMKYDQLGEKVIFQMFKNMISILTHENMRQHRKLDILSVRDMRSRIMTYLYYEQKKHRSAEFDIPYNREDLASYLCVNRSALSRELSSMEKDGILQTNGRHFVLLDSCF